MYRFSRLGAIWFSTFVFSHALLVGQVGNPDNTDKLREIVALLRVLWGPDFDSTYQKYMLGQAPTVVLIPRNEMLRIAEARLDGRRRDGAQTQGLTMSTESGVKIVVVYDDIASLLAAAAINHEIGHFELQGKALSRNAEEARVRKIVDTRFFEKLFGKKWLQTTVAALRKKVTPVRKNSRVYQGYTPEAVETFYQQLRKAGVTVEKTLLHDRILGQKVFILTNSEKNILAALDADDAERFD